MGRCEVLEFLPADAVVIVDVEAVELECVHTRFASYQPAVAVRVHGVELLGRVAVVVIRRGVVLELVPADAIVPIHVEPGEVGAVHGPLVARDEAVAVDVDGGEPV